MISAAREDKLVTKDNIGGQLTDYAKSADVYSKTDVDGTFATKTELNAKANATALDDKANTDLSNLTADGVTKIKETMSADMNLKADKTYVDNALNGKADKTTVNTLVGRVADLNAKTTKITYDAALGTNVDGVTFNAGAVTGVTSINGTEIGAKEGGEYIHQDNSIWGNMKKVDTQVKTNADAIAQEKTDREKAIGNLTEDKNYIKKDKNVSDNLVELDKQAKTNADAIAQEKTDRENAIGSLTEDKNYIKKAKNVSDNLVELDKQAKTNADAITETNQRTAGITRNDIRNETSIEGKVTVDTDGNIKAEGTITSKGLDAGDGDIKTNGKVSAGNVSTGTLETTGNATIGGDLNVNRTLNTKDVTAETIHISKSEDKPDYKSEGSIIGEGGKLSVSNEKFDKINNITEKSELNVNEKGTVNWATSTDNATGNVTEGRSEVAADHIKNYVKKTEGGTTFGYEENITADGKVGTATDKDGNKNELTQTATGTENTVTSKDGNKSTTKQEAGSISSTVYDKDGNVKASSEMKEDGSISNNATGDITNTVGGKLTTTVAGQATEDFKGGLDTTVTGAENHTVTGTQTNIVQGGQINNISGGQKNNILTGNQETTVSDGSIINKAEHGDISNTAQNVTNEGTESVTNKVGTNEVKVSQDGVDIKADADKTIKESVGADTSRTMTDGRIIDKAGDMTVTTDKTTGTTFRNGTPNDTTVINGGTIGTNKVNANETNTKKLTAGVAAGADGGRLTVDANDGVKGSYKSGDYTSRSYILANTLMSGVDNGKEPIDADFVGSRTDHYMDGDKAKLDETVKDAAGSNVTNKTSTGTVTTIKAGDKENTVTSTADGTRFINSEANTAFEGGTYTDTTIKGNTITTGKVTMDYAEVMKDLGVHGNAKVDQNLEVGGTSTLKGDVTMESNAKVKKDLTVEGNTNLKNTKVDGTLEVTKRATFRDDVDIKKNLSVDGNATIKGDVTANSYKVGDKTYISAAGINANDQKITNVADGSISEGSKDAVNGGQLYGVKRDLEHQVDKVGANAAAMANLRPMEFDPSSKWNIAAAIGNYGSETAAALGAFYRPNDNVMVNLSTAFGTGENMVGGGVSVRLGKSSNKLSREENNALKAQVDDLTARMDALLSVLNPNMSKDFPDVPENHWAYEAVSRLAGNDIVQGYPDGEFHGERTMTRYEMAEIIYNALSRGAEAEKELVEEFKPELQAMAASEKATAEKAEG